jgi:hypothetical protein
MKKEHQEKKHFLISTMLSSTQKYWAHVYLMCDAQFDTQRAVNKMFELLEDKGVTPFMPMVLVTGLSIATAGRVRELALANGTPDQVQNLDKAKELAFCLWIVGDDATNTELEMIH